ASFNGINGAAPGGNLILDGNDNLFGTTARGGKYDYGTVFELCKGASVITTVVSFNGSDGDSPGALVMDSSGKLFGATGFGGPGWDPANIQNSRGGVFEVANGSGKITALDWFKSIGAVGGRGLLEDPNGNLFGVASTAAASIFGGYSSCPKARAGLPCSL